jgi:hypothetical protein
VEKGVDVNDAICESTLMSVNNTAGNEGTTGNSGGERPDPVVPFETAGWPSGKASGSYPEDTGSTPVPATNRPDYAKRRPWLNAEEELLKRYYCVPFKMSIPWIAKVLRRTPTAVQKKILAMKLRRVGLKNRGLKEWLRNGGSLELPESVVGVTNITEADRRDAARLDAELRKINEVEAEIQKMLEANE